MDGYSVFLWGVGVLVVLAIAGLPLRLSWPQRVRWTVASQAMGPLGPLMYLPLDLREVRLVSVDLRSRTLALGLLEAAHPACDTMFLVTATEPPADLLSTLRDWCSLQTPMLLHIDASGIASLHGPVAAVVDLRRIGVPTAQAA